MITLKDITLIFKTFNRLHLSKQTLPCFPEELTKIIIDDSSEDGTQEWLSDNYKKDNVKLVFNEKNLNNSLNIGSHLAKTKYIWQVDNDIIHKPEAVSLLLSVLNGMDEFDCFVGFYGQSTQRWRDHYHDKIYITRKSERFVYKDVHMLLGDVNVGSIAYKKSTYEKVGDFRPGWGSDREYTTRVYENKAFMVAPGGSLNFVKDIGKKTDPMEVRWMKTEGQKNLKKWKEKNETILLQKQLQVGKWFLELDKIFIKEERQPVSQKSRLANNV